MRDVVIPYNTMPYEIVKPPSKPWAHSQTIADQGERKDWHCEFHSPRKTSCTASSPWPHH